MNSTLQNSQNTLFFEQLWKKLYLEAFILILRKIAEELSKAENNSYICPNSSFLLDANKVV